MCKKLVEVLFNEGYVFYGQTPERIHEVIEWYADRRNWKIRCYNPQTDEVTWRKWEAEADVADTVSSVMCDLYEIHNAGQWDDFLFIRKMGWEEDWRRVHRDRSEGSDYHFHFLPTYILGKERIPKQTEGRPAAWWHQFHLLVQNQSVADERIPLHQYPAIMARANAAGTFVGRSSLLLYLRLLEHYRNTAAPGWLRLIESYPAEVLQVLKKHPKFEVFSSYLEEFSDYQTGGAGEDLLRIAEAPKITPNLRANPGAPLTAQIAFLAGRSPIEIAHRKTGEGWFSDNKVAGKAIASFYNASDLIQYALDYDPQFKDIVSEMILSGGKEHLRTAHRCKHGQVALWFFHKFVNNPNKWTQRRTVHGPAGVARTYCYIEMLDEIEIEDLVNGLRTSVDVALEASSRRLEALYLAEMGENQKLPVLSEVKETTAIRQIVNSEDLKEEGKIQHNCVGGYIFVFHTQ